MTDLLAGRSRGLLIASLVVVFLFLFSSAGQSATSAAAPPTCKGQVATLWGTSGDDVLEGTDGPDVIVGLGGDDVIKGLKGADIICGNGGDDILYGNAGNDKIYGQGGKDILLGGLGDDYLAGGEHRDKVSFKNADQGVTVDLLAGTATGEGTDTLVSIRDATGSEFGDTISGTNDGNILTGKNGSDTIYGKQGADEIYGGNGNDDLFGGPKEDFIEGGYGSDLIKGGSHADELKGGGGSDTIYGEDGPDTLSGNKGFDKLVGGKKSDHCTSGELTQGCESGFKKFGSGSWLVTGEVKPGFYRNSSSSSGCYWARLSGFSGDLDDIMSNEFTYDKDIVEITGDEAGIESSSCGTWSNDMSSIKSPGAPMGDGAFLVNNEVEPGLWRNTNSSDGCYWERTTGFTNDFGEILANGFSYSIQTVQIFSSDFGFTSSGCGTWNRIGN